MSKIVDTLLGFPIVWVESEGPVPKIEFGDFLSYLDLRIGPYKLERSKMYINTLDIKLATQKILEAIGEDPLREGLQGTPRRVAEFYREFIDYNPGKLDVTFECARVDQMIVLKLTDPIYSLCEHHLLPIEMYVSMGYISENAKVLGLSKLARVAHKYAHRLQLQERYTSQVAREVAQLANTNDVAVLVDGKHFCMMMRGVKTQGVMTTSAMYGRFRENPQVRAEFLKLIERR